MGSNSTLVVLARIRERRERDVLGRTAAANELLQELTRSAEAVKLAVHTIGGGTRISVADDDAVDLWVDDKGEMHWSRGTTEGLVDCVSYDPIAKKFTGRADTVEAVFALATFVEELFIGQ